ncbi:metal-dependent hydrolase [Candidatus Woesearchaeota archaeon]|nr:metal-dependent hydrolase [Candidatus Woesearchaeota archaeon]
MRGVTHILTGILAGITLYDGFLSVAITALGSLFPDIDNSGSLISSNTGIRFVSKIFAHRGFFHSLWIPIFLYILVVARPEFSIIIIPFIAGYCVHIIGDSITPKGIKLFYPLKTPRLRGSIATGSWIENIIMMILLVITIYVIARRIL